MKIKKLRANHIEQPMGFALCPLSLSWVVEDAEGEREAWSRVEIFDGEERIYDSGERTDINRLDFMVDTELLPRHHYSWRVTVHSISGNQCREESWFETGKMDEQWQAEWISPILEKNSALLKKTFFLDDFCFGARIYLCGLGVYECYLNGQKVGDEYLAPGYHSYDFHLQAQTYNADGLLKRGINELCIALGEGWFKGRLGFDGGYTNLYGDRLYAIAELHIPQQNGQEMLIKTDESWVALKSPVLQANIYDGELYDARIEGDTSREESTLALSPEHCGALTDRYSLPIRSMETLSVKNVLWTPADELVLDFGQNLTGWVEIDTEQMTQLFPASAKCGKKLKLTAGEIMQNDCFYHENYRTAKAEFCYIFSGKETSTHIRPHFTYYGFRYMKLEMEEIDVCVCYAEHSKWEHLIANIQKCFVAHHLRSDFEQTGFLKTGNAKVNQLVSNALWSQKDNFLDVPTDCPQRDERLGWTGDAQVFSQTACLNMYMPAFYRKYLWDMRAEQSVLDGAVPNVVPRLKKGMVAEYGACPWADAGVLIPWNVYQCYGNKTFLREAYPGMKEWVDYQHNQEKKGDGAHLIKTGFHFGDWLALDSETPSPFGATDPLYIASAYYYRCCDIVSKTAKLLGYQNDAEYYAALSSKILAAIRNDYFDSDGLCKIHTQTASALAIEFGLTKSKLLEGNQLNKRVIAKKFHLDTGFVGTTMLCPALSHTGHHDTAISVLLNSDYPGWLYCVDLGATTIWERWNSVLPNGKMNSEGMNSLNHYSYGSILAWLYMDVCGISPQEPGFRKAFIRPNPDFRLGHTECVLNTSAGIYAVKWSYTEDKKRVKYRFDIPFGASALLILPGEREQTLENGIHEMTVSL